MKQLQTTLNGKEILLVEVPEGITGEGMHVDTGTLFWSSEVNMPFTGWDCHFDPAPVIPEDFKLLGLCPEIKEEVAYSLVERDTLNAGTRPACKNYENGMFVFSDPRSSLRSFLKSHHFNPETTVILLRQ